MSISASPQDGDLAAKIESLTHQLNNLTDTIQNSSQGANGSSKQQTDLVEAAQRLIRVANPPMNKLMDTFVSIAGFTATRLFIKWKVFENIPINGSISYEDLAAKVGAEANLIRRIAGNLVSTGILKQIGSNDVAHTSASQAYAFVAPIKALVQMGFDKHLRSMLSMPRYFEQYGLKEPASRYDTIYAFSAGHPDKTVWEIMNSDPDAMTAFMITMEAMSQKMGVAGSYDFSWVLSEAAKSQDRALIVDVGGGKGHAIKAICRATPGLPVSRCVVEDLPAVVEEAKTIADAELKEAQFVALDFHQEQPIKGALIYYIRRCLHDYGDDDCVEMLQRIRDAMEPDSKLLIAEQIASNPPSPMGAASDLVMTFLGGKERTLEGFQDIASRAGLRVNEAYESSPEDVAVIECVPV